MSVLFMTRYLGFDKYLMNECKKQVIYNPKAKVGSLKKSTKLTNPFPIFLFLLLDKEKGRKD